MKPELPEAVIQPKTFIAPTISPTGRMVIFGFRLEDDAKLYAIGWEDLAHLIRYLQFAADAAREQRIKTNPAAKALENPEIGNFVVVERLDFHSDAAGRLAVMEAMTTQGILVGAQVERQALQRAYACIFDVLRTMDERRKQSERLQ